jgi:hypothetical protein
MSGGISSRRMTAPSRHPLKGQPPMSIRSAALFAAAFLLVPATAEVARAQVPEAIAAPGETMVATLHAEGAQIYDCKAASGAAPAWQFREPIATLVNDGKTVGRHYAGPSWELADGSKLVGKVVGRAPGATAKDIPLLKLEATAQGGPGQLAGATTVQRLNTKGGVAEGPCDKDGALLSVPYSADYVFLKKGA